MIKVDIDPNSHVTKVLVTNGSLEDVLYFEAFLKMGYKKEDLSPPKELMDLLIQQH